MSRNLEIRSALVTPSANQFVISETWLAPPREKEALVRLVGCGICHTDLTFRHQPAPNGRPRVLGHEGSGGIEAIGPDVTGFLPGDHVVLTFLSCGQCRGCLSGVEAACEMFLPLNFGGCRQDGSHALHDHNGPIHDRFFGQSAFSTYAIAHERNMVRVPTIAPLELLGPFGCGFQTGAGAVINVLKVPSGATVAVFGAGAVGLCAVMMARYLGAITIVVVDVNPQRLELALTLGATHIIDARTADVVHEIRRICGAGVDFSLDTSGHSAAMRQAIDALGWRGVCGLVGVTPGSTDVAFDAGDLLVKSKSIRGIVEGGSAPGSFIPWLVDLYLKGSFPIDRLITLYPFEEINRAAADSLDGRTIKPILVMS
jgi:aryl-alcohol dehydrogenase